MAPSVADPLRLETLLEKKYQTSRLLLKTKDYLCEIPRALGNIVWNEHFNAVYKFLCGVHQIITFYCNDITNISRTDAAPVNLDLYGLSSQAKCDVMQQVIDCILRLVNAIKLAIHCPVMNDPRPHDILYKVCIRMHPYLEKILLKFLWG